jgi:hypothetical protein
MQQGGKISPLHFALCSGESNCMMQQGVKSYRRMMQWGVKSYRRMMQTAVNLAAGSQV